MGSGNLLQLMTCVTPTNLAVNGLADISCPLMVNNRILLNLIYLLLQNERESDLLLKK